MKCKALLLALLMPVFIFSQKQGNIWLFGNQGGLNFNSGSPVVYNGGQTSTNVGAGENQEGTSCISDSSGALLFYANGRDIWNRNHQVMLNGSGIMGGISATQAALIVPYPGNDSLFYVFTADDYQSYSTPPRKGYRYSIVNMCLDNGLGGVRPDQKNIFLADSATEKLSVCLDGAGTGYWVVGHKLFSNQFIAWHLGSTGITSTVTTNLGTVHGISGTNPPNPMAASGQMKISPDGSKLALVFSFSQPAILDIFDFSNVSGSVSNHCRIPMDSALSKVGYGVEFSPDGSRIYANLNGGTSGGTRLYQYDLVAGGCAAIKTSSILVHQAPSPALYGMQLGPDNKIYMVALGNLGVINSPNVSGAGCNFVSSGLSGVTFTNTYTLPSFVAGYQYLNNLVSCPAFIITSSSASVICAGEQATLSASGATTYTWSNGVISPSIVVSPSTTTTYTVWCSGNGMAYSVTAMATQSVAACTGLWEGATGLSIRIFPNPARGQVNVTASAEMDVIEVYDAFGKQVYTCRPAELKHAFVLPEPGFYVLRVSSAGRAWRQKILIEK